MKLFYQIVGFAILLLSCHPFKAAKAFVASRGGNVNSLPCSKTSPSIACYNVYSTGRSQRSQSQLNLLAPMPFVDTDTLHSIVTTASPSLVISETEPWVKPLSRVLGPFLNLFSFAMLCRVVISWYPKSNLNEFPYNLVVWPTEPLLRGIRGAVPPAFGVDITPIVWLAVFTFFNEILLGQQGLLTMKMKYGI